MFDNEKEGFLPTRYFLEVYEGSFANDPSYLVKSSTPFSSPSVGQYFNDFIHDRWYDQPIRGKEKFIIKEIEQIIWVIEGSHNAQKVMVLLFCPFEGLTN